MDRLKFTEFLVWLEKRKKNDKVVYTERKTYVLQYNKFVAMRGNNRAPPLIPVDKDIKVEEEELKRYLKDNPAVAEYLQMNPTATLS